MAVVGRILLGILIFLLAVILLLLFFPVSYEVFGEFREEKKGVSVRVKWLFGFVRFFLEVPKPGTPILKILWFNLLGDKKEKKPKKKKEKPKDKAENGATEDGETEDAATEAEAAQDATDTADVAAQDATDTADGTAQDATDTTDEAAEQVAGQASNDVTDDLTQQASGDSADGNDSTAETVTDQTAESAADQTEEESSKESSKKKKKKDKKEKEKKPKSKKSLKEKLTELVEELRFYKDLWEDGNTKPFVKAALTRVLHLIKNLLPRKIRGKLLFGAASPDVTGYAYGGYTVMRSLYPKRVSKFEFTPDFDDQILEGELTVKGWFMIFTVIYDALRILLDKRFRILRKKWKAHKEKNKKLEASA